MMLKKTEKRFLSIFTFFLRHLQQRPFLAGVPEHSPSMAILLRWDGMSVGIGDKISCTSH